MRNFGMEKTIIAKQLVAMMIKKLKLMERQFPVRDLLIWAEREYGGMTLEDIGCKHSIGRERVRQIHIKTGVVVNKIMKEKESL